MRRAERLAVGALLALCLLPAGPGAALGDGAPGAGPGAAPPPAGGGAAGRATTGRAAPLDADELSELDDLGALVDRYEGASREHQERLRQILRRERDARLRALEERFRERKDLAAKEYRGRHLSALAALERFLARYPDDPKWTPSVMFRLAELYLDQAGLEYEEKQLALTGAPPPAGPAPEELGAGHAGYDGPDYSRAIGLWRQIVERFPGYRQIDGTLYLLGVYLVEMGKTVEAKHAYRGLVCANKFNPLEPPPPPVDDDIRARIGAAATPPPAFVDPYTECVPAKQGSWIVDEAWVRLGELHFDTRGEMPLAIAAYQKLVANRESKFFDEALYKLGWAYYLNNQYTDGIKAFDDLIVFADQQEESSGKSSVELRQEAVIYIALSFSEVWPGDGDPDPNKALARAHEHYDGRLGEKHVRDVFEYLGDNLRAGEAWDQSIAAWRFTLEKWPLHPRSPVVHQKVVDALDIKGDSAAAMEERGRLALAYREGTDWYKANEMDREAMEYAARLAEQSLLASAKSTHRSAQLARDAHKKKPTPESKEAYLALYARAAELYDTYLKAFPTSTEVYELTFRFADCLFFGERYAEAAPHYRWVRDHRDLSREHFEEAALLVVQSYEAAVKQQLADGKLVEPPIPTRESVAGGAGPIELPELYRQEQQAYDEYMNLIDDQNRAPKTALAAAMISFRHLALDDALGRFSTIMDRYCQTPEAIQAKEGLLFIHQLRGDDAKYQATADAFIARSCGDDTAVKVARAQKISKEYEIAARLYEEKRFEEAGLKFYGVYKAAPEDDENRDDALFSAAVAYEFAGKPKTAIAIYQELVGNTAFKGSEYYVEALYRTAASHQAAFDYDSAVDAFLKVFDAAAEPGRTSRKEFDLAQARLDALWNAATLREQDRVYLDRGRNDPGAITLFQRYGALDTKNRARARDAAFRAALVYEKVGDTKNMIRAFGDWRRVFGGDAGVGEYYVFSFYKTARALEKARDKKAAAEAFKQTIQAFDAKNEKPGSPSAFYAGEAQFWLAEQYYKAYFEPYKVVWKGNITDKNQARAQKAVKDTLDALKKLGTDTGAGYLGVARFESGWSLAASVRLGDLSFFAGQKLIEAPVPKDIIRLDNANPEAGFLASYQGTIETLVQPQTEAAKEFWLKALDAARRQGVSNEWSKLAEQRLNAFIASDLYPVQRDPIVDREPNP